ncbi:MAG: WhiB family transcriptional regulator [Acidimicrobiales bacterium]
MAAAALLRGHDESCTPGPGANDWRAKANCRDSSPDLFFPVGVTGIAVEEIESAKAVCRCCPSQRACLDFALATNQDAGVWGGMSETERRDLRWSQRDQQRIH